MTIVTCESLQQLIDSASPEKQARIVGRALVALFNRQTASEQSNNSTAEYNNIGFSGADGRSGTLTAKYFMKHGKLLDWQIDRWLKPQRNGFARICKYTKQLNEIAQLKQAK